MSPLAVLFILKAKKTKILMKEDYKMKECGSI
jgi:hypothetical protein